jgi:hypothetical protein
VNEIIEMLEKSKSKTFIAEYVYRGDKQTAESIRGKLCAAVRREDGKCIRGKNGTMLVSFDGKKAVVIGRLLRKTPAVS